MLHTPVLPAPLSLPTPFAPSVPSLLPCFLCLSGAMSELPASPRRLAMLPPIQRQDACGLGGPLHRKCANQSDSQSYAARRVDRNGLTHRSIPDTGVMYKSGYFTVAAHMLKNTTSYFRNPFTSRSTYSPHIPASSRLNRSRDEGKYMHRVVQWRSYDLAEQKHLALYEHVRSGTATCPV